MKRTWSTSWTLLLPSDHSESSFDANTSSSASTVVVTLSWMVACFEEMMIFIMRTAQQQESKVSYCCGTNVDGRNKHISIREPLSSYVTLFVTLALIQRFVTNGWASGFPRDAWRLFIHNSLWQMSPRCGRFSSPQRSEPPTGACHLPGQSKFLRYSHFVSEGTTARPFLITLEVI